MDPAGDGALARQVHFLLEADRLKGVLRQTLLLDRSRRENSAEHSWHLALMALVLRAHAPDDLDLGAVLGMLAVHDLVEIDAGDTFLYDEAGAATKAEREAAAADRLFGLLPPEQARDLRALWEAFEARQSPEARFAAALDRLQPLLHNVHTGGASWRAHGIRRSQVEARARQIAEGSPALGDLAARLIAEAAARGDLLPD
jgi:putative hydrolase of HD superfamily